MIAQFGKESHAGALESGQRLQTLLARAPRGIETACFPFDLAGTAPLPADARGVGLVLTDLPYGRSAAWQGFADPAQALPTLLSRIQTALAPTAEVALVTRKDQPVAHPAYRRAEKLAVGHRHVSILEPIDP
jgi:23S rRNA (guanine2535-N1)-methyltransferase